MSIHDKTWTGSCTSCHREGVRVGSRESHGLRVLCDRCAIRPSRSATAVGLDDLERPQDALAGRMRGRDVKLTTASAIRSERLHWVWTGRMPRRSLVVVAGEKGLGKSLLTNARLPAQITRGVLEGELRGTPADVLVVTAEDDWASVVKPRLMAHDADLDRVHRVEVHDPNGDSLLTLPDDVPRLEKEIVALRDAGRFVAMLVVDPIGAFLAASTDTHRDASVRRALAPLAAMAERLDLVFVVVAHLTKDESGRLINRVSGAGAFVNAARSVLALARDPGDPDGEQGAQRVLLHVGSNWGRYAPTLAWRVEGRSITADDGSTDEVGYLVDRGETSIGVEDVQRGPDENSSDVEEAIATALAAGPRPSREVKVDVSAALRCSRKTVERAAMRMVERGEVRSDHGGFPRTTTWVLVSGDAAAGPMGTSSAGQDVPTESEDVPIALPGSCGDGGDDLVSDVATAAEHQLVEALRDAFDGEEIIAPSERSSVEHRHGRS